MADEAKKPTPKPSVVVPQEVLDDSVGLALVAEQAAHAAKLGKRK